MKHKISEYYLTTPEDSKPMTEVVSGMEWRLKTFDFEDADQLAIAMEIAEVDDADARKLLLKIMSTAIRLQGKLDAAIDYFAQVHKIIQAIQKEEVESVPQ